MSQAATNTDNESGTSQNCGCCRKPNPSVRWNRYHSDPLAASAATTPKTNDRRSIDNPPYSAPASSSNTE